MGGNALKGFGVRRVDPNTYNRIKEILINKIAAFTSKAAIPLELPGKKDYGDIDVLAVVKPECSNSLHTIIRSVFEPRVIKQNGGVISFNIDDLQIDLITTSDENFNMYYTYLCWGDLSMVMGRTARIYGLKYGIYGLQLPVRDVQTNHVVELIDISKEPKSIFPFLGYNYDRWKLGFKTEQEVKDFAFSSNLITKDFIHMASENVKARKRDKNRTVYKDWAEWFEANIHMYPDKKDIWVPLTMEDNLKFLEKNFPQSLVTEKYHKVFQRMEDTKKAREKFSGKYIQELFPELEGEDFGKLMKAWNTLHPDRIEYVLNTPLQDLKEEIKQLKLTIYNNG